MKLIDSDIAIDWLRDVPAADQWLNLIEREQLAISSFSVMELIRGARDKRKVIEVQALTRKATILPGSAAITELAISLLERLCLSHGLGVVDALIAATAIENDLPLHTFNRKHFLPITELRVIEPYSR